MIRRPFPTWPTLLLSAMAASALSASALAQDDYWDSGYDSGGGRGGGLFGDSTFSYGYIDFGYINHDFKPDGIDSADGLGGELSIPLFQSLYIKTGFSYASLSDLDYFAWELGAGLGLPLTGNLDLVLEGGLAHQNLEADVFDSFDSVIDGYGVYVNPYLRLGLGEIVELNGGILYRNVDSLSEFGVDLKMLLHLTSNISVWGSALLGEDLNQYGVGLRLSF